MVFSGLVIAWRLATCPTSRSPVLVNATTDGVVRPPSSLAMTLGSPPSITATQELVVPRSIPIIFAIKFSLKLVLFRLLFRRRSLVVGPHPLASMSYIGPTTNDQQPT